MLQNNLDTEQSDADDVDPNSAQNLTDRVDLVYLVHLVYTNRPSYRGGTMHQVSVDRPLVVKVADEVWIATALLHGENPQRADFTVSEIVGRAEREAIAGHLRPGVRVHVLLHCVANFPPNPGLS